MSFILSNSKLSLIYGLYDVVFFFNNVQSVMCLYENISNDSYNKAYACKNTMWNSFVSDIMNEFFYCEVFHYTLNRQVFMTSCVLKY